MAVIFSLLATCVYAINILRVFWGRFGNDIANVLGDISVCRLCGAKNYLNEYGESARSQNRLPCNNLSGMQLQLNSSD